MPVSRVILFIVSLLDLADTGLAASNPPPAAASRHDDDDDENDEDGKEMPASRGNRNAKHEQQCYCRHGYEMRCCQCSRPQSNGNGVSVARKPF